MPELLIFLRSSSSCEYPSIIKSPLRTDTGESSLIVLIILSIIFFELGIEFPNDFKFPLYSLNDFFICSTFSSEILRLINSLGDTLYVAIFDINLSISEISIKFLSRTSEASEFSIIVLTRS